MADEPSGFAAAAASIRDSAKWLLAAAAAVGAILVGGVQVSGVAKLPSPRLEWALASAFIGLVGVAWAVTGVGDLLLPRSFTMKELATATKGRAATLRKDLEARAELLGGWGTTANLAGALDRGMAEYQAALAAWDASPPGDAKKAARAVLDEQTAALNQVTAVTRDAGDWANYLSLRNDYRHVLNWRILPGVLIALLGLVGVMLVSAERESSPGVDLSKAVLPAGTSLAHAQLAHADLSHAKLAGVVFTFADLTGASLEGSDLAGADFTSANLTGATLTGADLSNAKWSKTTCPDGANSDDVGGSCEAHLTALPKPSG